MMRFLQECQDFPRKTWAFLWQMIPFSRGCFFARMVVSQGWFRENDVIKCLSWEWRQRVPCGRIPVIYASNLSSFARNLVFSENRIFRKSLYGSAEMCVIPRKRCSISWESHFSPKRCIVPRKRCIILWNHCLISQESYFLQKLCIVPRKCCVILQKYCLI